MLFRPAPVKQLDRDIKWDEEQTSRVIANIIKINLKLIVASKCTLFSPIQLPRGLVFTLKPILPK
jgi:hypothetical protein